MKLNNWNDLYDFMTARRKGIKEAVKEFIKEFAEAILFLLPDFSPWVYALLRKIKRRL